MSITRHFHTPIAHRAVVHGETIYLAGMVADDKSLAVGGQLTQSLEKIDALLKTLNSSAEHLLSVTVYLADFKDKAPMNDAWLAFFQTQNVPTRATVGVAALGPGTLVEVVATAAVAQAVK